MNVSVNGYDLPLQEGDEVTVTQHPCDSCGKHTEIEVQRGGKRVVHCGDAVDIWKARDRRRAQYE